MKKPLKIILPIIIIVVGVIAAKQLVNMKRAPHKAEKTLQGILVKVVEVKKENIPVTISSTGIVQPRSMIDITPQVNGKITWVAPNFVAGGFFKEGDRLFSLEKDDYQLALEKAGAEMAQAELEFARVESQASIARQEWQTLNPDTQPSPLVVYEPQVKSAKARIASASANIRKAQLDLKRTTLYAPFDCRIRSESIDLGQYVRSGSPVAKIAGTSVAEVIVPLSPGELQWLEIPGSKSTVIFSGTEMQKQWQGQIVRSLGEVDSQNRMVAVVVSVDDPYELKKTDHGKLALAEGMFVTVVIKGRVLKNTIEIPRSGLRDDSTIWLADSENKLLIRPVKLIRKTRDSVIIAEGLEEGERVIVTGVNGAANGMELRIISPEAAK